MAKQEEKEVREILREEQMVKSKMSSCDYISITFTTVLMYARLMVDLYLFFLYLSSISQSGVSEGFKLARDAFWTFIIMLLPGILMFLNGIYIRYPEEYAEEFKEWIEQNELYHLPYYFPEGFTYLECTRVRKCFTCCGEHEEFDKTMDGIILQLMNSLQIRAGYDLTVSLFKLQRVTGAWRDAVTCSVILHATPQVFLQSFLFYFSNATSDTSTLLDYEIDIYYGQLASIITNMLGIVCTPNYGPLFDYAYVRPRKKGCCGDVAEGGVILRSGEQEISGVKEYKIPHDDEETDDVDFKHGKSPGSPGGDIAKEGKKGDFGLKPLPEIKET